MTYSERYDDAVGDVNAAIAKLDTVLFDIKEDEEQLYDPHFDRSDPLQGVIDKLKFAVDFDHLSLDTRN